MTDKPDNMNEEEHVIPVNASVQLQPLHDDSDSDFDEEEEGLGSGELEAVEGELTPNDIFGLDPLDVLTLEEVAEYLKVSPAAARRVIKEQNLPGRNIGGEWRFLRDAVANWLRGQEAPAQQQQKAREDYAKPKPAPAREEEGERFTRPPQRPYQSEQSGGGGEYRPRQQYGNQGGGQYGNRGGQYGNQYGGGQGQYGGGGGGGQYGGGGGGQYGGGSGGGGYGGGAGGSYDRPPRRPFRAAEGGAAGGQAEGSGDSAQGGARFGGGGSYGGQRFAGGPKRKNKRQVFDGERGRRLDRRKEGEGSDTPE